MTGPCCMHRATWLLAVLLAVPRAIAAQGPGSGFSPGTRTIVDLNFAGTPVGDFPKGLRLLHGNLEVVDKDGARMLRASSPSEFVLQLPEVLPKIFTLEMELIPKECCNPVDLMVEGVVSGGRSSVSAQLEWDADHFAVVGGNREMFQMDMPAAIAATLPSALTTVAWSFEDETVTMYTNGQRVYTLGARKFMRGRVLRISLGGQDDDRHAVYLKSVRVADMTPAIVTSNAPQAGPRSVTGAAPAPNAVAPPPAAAATPAPGFAVSVAPGATGPVVSWSPVPTATGYTVTRYKIDDVTCCNNSSGRGWLSALSWQDAPPPVSGRYVYLALAQTAAGQLRGQATFDYTQASTSPTVSPPIAASLGTVPSGFTVTVTMGATGPLVSWPPLPNATRYAVERYKIDDLACCGSTSGRTPATSPWQDAPLPMSGTYGYRVTAYTLVGQILGETYFGFRMPGGSAPSQPAPINGVLVSPTTTGTSSPMPAPVNGVLVSPTTTATATPMPAPTTPTITSPTATAPLSGTNPVNPNQTAVLSSQPSGGGAPSKVWFGLATPAAVRVFWDWPATATQYTEVWYSVRRAISGTSTWTQLTPTPLKQTYMFDDVVPDPRQTYTYVVTATHLDGTSGSTSADYWPAAPQDPGHFTAEVVAPDEVLLTWDRVRGGYQFLLTGPGMGNGMLTDGTPMTSGQVRHTYSVKGLSSGTHTWRVATSYQPGGVMTPASAWPVASASIGLTTAKYLITVESVRANNNATDNIANLDGVGNEILVTAAVDFIDKAGTVTSSSTSSVLYGDISQPSPPVRVQSGQGRPNGGIGTGDVVTPIWESPLPGASGYTRLVLWQGQLTEGEETVKVIPIIWEWDNGSGISNLYRWRRFLTSDAVTLDLSQRGATGEITNVGRDEPWYVSNGFGIYPGAMWTTVTFDEDRPIGVAWQPPDITFENTHSYFYPIAIQVTQSVAEAAIAGAYGAPGIIPIRFVDHLLGSKIPVTRPEYGYGDYTLNLRIERIP